MIAIIFGTRPEIIKLSPVIRLLSSRKVPFSLIHTNQHYSQEMDHIFFQELGLPNPHFNLGVGSGTHAEIVAKSLLGIEPILIEQKPIVVIVQGDTNSALAGGLAAAKLGIKVVHIEAGLRSYDRRMPEELNRILLDHLADVLLPPTELAEKILKSEGIPADKIHVVGNTITDALNFAIPQAEARTLVHGLLEKKYILSTLHRQENTDDPITLQLLLDNLNFVGKKLNKPICLPLHPRTKKIILANGLVTEEIKIVDPVGYFDFIKLLMGCSLVLTDSGGIQEEACILGIPCITLRENTERPETVQIGSNILVGSDLSKLDEAVNQIRNNPGKWQNPYGDGHSAERILELL